MPKKIRNMGTATMRFNEGVIISGSIDTNYASAEGVAIVCTGSVELSANGSNPAVIKILTTGDQKDITFVRTNHTFVPTFAKLLATTDGSGSGLVINGPVSAGSEFRIEIPTAIDSNNPTYIYKILDASSGLNAPMNQHQINIAQTNNSSNLAANIISAINGTVPQFGGSDAVKYFQGNAANRAPITAAYSTNTSLLKIDLTSTTMSTVGNLITFLSTQSTLTPLSNQVQNFSGGQTTTVGEKSVGTISVDTDSNLIMTGNSGSNVQIKSDGDIKLYIDEILEDDINGAVRIYDSNNAEKFSFHEVGDVHFQECTQFFIKSSANSPKMIFTQNNVDEFNIGYDHSDADKLKIGTGNDFSSTVVTVDGANTQLGVGTSSPNETLTVEGVLSLKEGSYSINNHTGYGKLFTKSSDSSLYYRNDSGTEYNLLSADGLWQADGSLIFPVNDTDRVILGDTDTFDGVTLTVSRPTGGAGDVDGDITVANCNMLVHRPSTTSGAATAIGFLVDNSSPDNSTTPGAAIMHTRKGSSSHGQLEFMTKNGTSLSGNCHTRMKIDAYGRVGIGYRQNTRDFIVAETTDKDVGVLSIHSHEDASDANKGAELNFSRHGGTSVNDGLNLGEIKAWGTEDNSSYYSAGYIIFEAAEAWNPGSSTAGKIKIGVTKNGDTSPTDTIVIDGSDVNKVRPRVGIGTNNPTAKLHVSTNDDDFAFRLFNGGDNSNRKGIRISCGMEDDVNPDTPKQGTLIEFVDGDGGFVGNITFNGTTVQYNQFTGAHFGYYHDESHRETFEQGDIIILSRNSILEDRSNQPKHFIKKSDASKQKSVFGVFGGIGLNVTNSPDILINAVGDGVVKVCNESGNIEIGDYICTSTIPGVGMKQESDSLKNYTVAKACQSVDWSQETENIKLIACTYHCG